MAIHARHVGMLKRLVTVTALVFLSGCWWQRDDYTRRMQLTMQTWERDAELDRLLGEPFQPPGEFPMWIRPPRPTELRQMPAEMKDFVALFQGGDPLIEVVVMGSAGNESLLEFEQKAFAAVNAAQKGAGSAPEKRDPATVQCLHGGETAFELFSIGGQRQIQAQGAQPATVAYQWVFYFAEEGPQKIMVTFIVPDSKYSEFGEGMVPCLESLALGGKVATAQAGGGSPAPAAPAAGAGAPAGGGAPQGF